MEDPDAWTLTMRTKCIELLSIAGKIAEKNRKRPCFKNMDSLCARLQQDLDKPDALYENIHSQGIIWAIKDFVFCITRIMDAWVVFSNYVYCPSDLCDIKHSMDPKNVQIFMKWQNDTIVLVEKMLESIISWDELARRRRGIR